jgi:hypothetical protein
MGSARSLANQKLYHAALHQRMLEAELAKQDVAASVLLEAVGPSIQLHLRQAYGWFLLELAEVTELPPAPPLCVAQLCSQFDVGEPLRGELVELQNLEQRHGWLAELLTDRPLSPSVSARAAPAGLGVMQSDWSQEELQAWYEALAGLIERMSDSLDEW